jgi:hypothetical protein
MCTLLGDEQYHVHDGILDGLGDHEVHVLERDKRQDRSDLLAQTFPVARGEEST